MLLAYAPASVLYLVWLAGVIDWGTWLGPTLYALMLFSLATTTAFLWLTRTVLVPVARHTNLDRTVDALITTCSEPISVVERTLRGALAINGLRDVHVLDDGSRPELGELAAQLGGLYHARGARTHAKAGNLNFGLAFTDAEFLVILDADHAPVPRFLERTLGYLDDPGLAVVQTPQSYHNESFLFRDTRRGRWSAQDMFYNCIQPAKNRWNAVFFVGTSAILRRRAIDDVGGFSTSTATEDIHTAIRMHARGWRSVFVPEVLASGLEIQNLRELYQQRRRWAAGSMGLLLRSPDSPLRIRGLTMPQRLNYLHDMLSHQHGTLQLAFQLLPIAATLTLTAPINTPPAEFVAVTAVFIALTWFAVWMQARGTFHLLHTPASLLATSFSNIAGLLAAFRDHGHFRPARKNARRNESSLVKRALWGLAVLSVAALARDIALLLGDPGPNASLAISCAIFITLNLVALLDFLLPLRAYERSSAPSSRPAQTGRAVDRRGSSAPGLWRRGRAPIALKGVAVLLGFMGVMTTAAGLANYVRADSPADRSHGSPPPRPHVRPASPTPRSPIRAGAPDTGGMIVGGPRYHGNGRPGWFIVTPQR